jgi:hypothetical protein
MLCICGTSKPPNIFRQRSKCAPPHTKSDRIDLAPISSQQDRRHHCDTKRHEHQKV